MMVRELIDRLFVRIQAGEIRGDDPVPTDILEEEHEDPAEYLARKYGIRGDADDSKGST